MLKLNAILIFICMLLSSCEFEEDNQGYDKKVSFDACGGEKTICGNDSYTYLIIAEGENEHHSDCPKDENSAIVVSHKWLTAKTERGSHALTFVAVPNTTNTKRMFTVYGYFGNKYAVIKVTQAP